MATAEKAATSMADSGGGVIFLTTVDEVYPTTSKGAPRGFNIDCERVKDDHIRFVIKPMNAEDKSLERPFVISLTADGDTPTTKGWGNGVLKLTWQKNEELETKKSFLRVPYQDYYARAMINSDDLRAVLKYMAGRCRYILECDLREAHYSLFPEFHDMILLLSAFDVNFKVPAFDLNAVPEPSVLRT